MSDHDRFEAKPHQVWVGKGNLGYRRSIESAGTVAAPLLAGFSFTLLVLLLPTLGAKTTTVETGVRVRVVTQSQAFSAMPEVAAILLLLAGLLLIGSVQAAIAMRFSTHTPADYEEWYPQFFREGEAGEEPPSDLSGWTWRGVEPIAVGTKWYGGWPRWRLLREVTTANWWAAWARWLYHGGIVCLLLGLAFLVVPTASDESTGRWLLFAFAAAGVLAEAAWISLLQCAELCDRRERRQTASQPAEAQVAGQVAGAASSQGDPRGVNDSEM